MGRKGARDVLHRDAHREIKKRSVGSAERYVHHDDLMRDYRQQGDMAAGLLRRFVGNLEKLYARLREFAEEK